MQPWRIIAVLVLVVLLIPTVTLMNQVEKSKTQGDNAQLQKKQRMLQWCIRLLIALFVVILGFTMYQHYATLASL